ncbi:hypothetical protein [Enterobacter soli]|uniref:hypothetical protein n=1 Tax=Enterobacter soli TaxID=885040 RepID=UPI002F41AE7E
MSPTELLKSVIPRFTPLLHDNDIQLNALLVQALRTYQDCAGYATRTRIQKTDSNTIALPDDYLQLVSLTDATGDWVYSDVIDGQIEFERSPWLRWPLTMEYLVNLSELDLEKGVVPATLVGIIQDYLEALIAIPNYDRIRRVSIASKLDVSNLPDEATLHQRKIDLETGMANRGAIPRGTVIYSSNYAGWGGC